MGGGQSLKCVLQQILVEEHALKCADEKKTKKKLLSNDICEVGNDSVLTHEGLLLLVAHQV